MSGLIDTLASLHTSAIDARNGYREAMKDAEGKGLSPLFSELAGLHEKHAGELAQQLAERGQTPDEDGSFMSVVHKTIMDVRSLFGGLDESVIPGLIDGEQRNVKKYEDVLKEPGKTAVWDILSRQRAELAAAIDKMTAMKQTM
jgi:uncharacterized protein (TIGR02284 family)